MYAPLRKRVRFLSMAEPSVSSSLGVRSMAFKSVLKFIYAILVAS
jgi:hypothetical protein